MIEATAKALIASYLGCTTLDSRPVSIALDLSTRDRSQWLLLPDGPLTAITELSVDGSDIQHLSTLPVWELKLDQPYSSGDLVLEGTLGWETLPDQIQVAVDELIAFHASQTPGVKSEAIGRRSRTFQEVSGESGLPPLVEALLRPYRRLYL